MRTDLLNRIGNIKIEDTKKGFKLVGYKESIEPLGMYARIIYKKKLKSRRLMKKYAKKALMSIIQDFINDYKEKSFSNHS